MVKQTETFGTQSNPISADDWSGTETINLDVARTATTEIAMLYRYINGLDVNVDITVDATDSKDSSFNDSEELRGSGSDSEATLTVSNDGADSDFVTEPWEFLRIGVTPASNPSSGQFTLRQIEQSSE